MTIDKISPVRSCTNDSCHIEDGESCAMGEDAPCDCEFYTHENDDITDIPESNEYGVLWSGNTLGVQDLRLLQARDRSLTVGVLGSHNTGKTTFLLIAYLNHIRRGIELTYTFAGSKTLGAWENLSSWPRLDTSKSTFPPHTSRQAERMPGLLHLALRDNTGELVDLLLTDAPGEWFTTWALNAEDSNAEGAQWTAINSDLLIITADCKKLSGSDRGKARGDLINLFQRLSPFAKGKPTFLVWTKTDELENNPIPMKIKETIVDKLLKNIPHAKQHEVSIQEPDSVTNVLHALLKEHDISKNSLAITTPIIDNTSFMSYRGNNAQQ
ncbi:MULTISPECIES: TRAFAC clade GTPase domain-containing protein [unclassified Psychrobacter]|uniref:TRAFAC clade GTPase domain-containing protein n=1 Tax=unclassified Psychrobacter TaxID=196806 RepID=UPI0025D3E194|nr:MULTISPECIES: hypothetical protein [unclassified Psychrobacter]